MATTETIRRLRIQAVAEGFEDAQRKTQQLADAQGSVVAVLEKQERAQMNVTRSYERLAAQIDPAFRAQQQFERGQRTLDRALQQGVIDANRYAASLDLLRTKYTPLSAANTNLSHQTGNVAAQFQDIAVQLAGGQSPFLIALQQGTQLTGALGDRGAKGAVQALGAGFLSLLSPVSLASIAAITFGGTLVQYLTSAGEEVETLDDKLKRHADVISSIKDAYGEAAEGVEKYASETRGVLEAQMNASMESLKASLRTQALDIERMMSTAVPAFTDPATGVGFGGVDLQVRKEYEAFATAIERLRAETAAGTPNVRAFRQAVAEAMQAAGDNAKVRELGAGLLKASEEAFKLEQALTAAERSISVMNGTLGAGIGNLDAYKSALEALSKIALPDVGERGRALEQYRKALEGASGLEERRAAQQAYDATLGRIADRERERAEEEARREAEREARRAEREGRRLDDFERTWKQIQDQNNALEIQSQTFGMAAGEAARYRAEQQLIAAAQRANVELTPSIVAEIERMAVAAGVATERLEQMRAQARAVQEFESIGKDALKGFLSDLRQGKDLADSLANALDRVVDKLLDMMLNSLFDPKSQQGFNIFSMLFDKGGKSVTLPSITLDSTPAPQAWSAAPQSISANIASSIVPPLRDVAASATEASASLGGIPGQIASMLKGIGATDSGIAGFLGNVKRESNFDPYAVNPSSGAFGLFQHLGSRRRELFAFAGTTRPNAAQQIEFARNELLYGDERGALNLLRSAGDLRAGVNAGLRFERPEGWSLSNPMGAHDWSIRHDFAQQFTKVTQQVEQSLTKVSDAVVEGAQDVGGAFGDTTNIINQSGNGIGDAFNNVISQLNKAGSGGGGFGGLFGSLFGGGTSFQGFNISDVTLPSDFSLSFHQGGTVGSGGRLRHLSLMDQIAFMSAPRLHAGTLRPDERYAILQTGEHVLSRDDVQNARRNGQSGSGGKPVVNVNVINNAGVDVETQQRPDGSIDVVIEALESRMGQRAQRGKGALYKGVVSRAEGRGLMG